MNGHPYDHVLVDEQLVPAPAELGRRVVDEIAQPVQVPVGREARRAKSDFVVATPAVRGKTVGLVGSPELIHTRQPAPNDMRPREVDRKAVKAKRKRAAANRRKRK